MRAGPKQKRGVERGGAAPRAEGLGGAEPPHLQTVVLLVRIIIYS